MDEKRKAISADDRLRALALFTVAKEHERKAWAFEQALNRMLCIEHGGHMSDALWSTESVSVADFDAAMAREGIVVVEEDP